MSAPVLVFDDSRVLGEAYAIATGQWPDGRKCLLLAHRSHVLALVREIERITKEASRG